MTPYRDHATAVNTIAAVPSSRPPSTNSTFCTVRVDASGPGWYGGPAWAGGSGSLGGPAPWLSSRALHLLSVLDGRPQGGVGGGDRSAAPARAAR